MTSRVQFRLRIYKDEGVAIGPGKVALLEAVAEYGSISAAARHLGMSYRRAWLLIDETNHAFKSPTVETATGGSHGGGATQSHRVARRVKSAVDRHMTFC